jgi:RNA polymerase sigma factor (TIGR02999 family)
MLSPQGEPRDVTQLLGAWHAGDQTALEKLTPLVYGELHRLAQQQMRRAQPDPTLQTTALIHEAYLQLVDVRNVPWQNRAHFFALCARLMRCILVDFARARHSAKRGGGERPVSLEESAIVSPAYSPTLMAVHDALDTLAKIDHRKAQVVELRFFGGLTVTESAEVLQVSAETVRRDWKMAKLWLLREMNGAR